MKFKHLGIMINNVSEITDFYENIFEMKKVRVFELNSNLCEKFFNISQPVEIHLMQKDDVEIELFIRQEMKQPSFEHFCLSFANRNKIVDRAIKNNYEVIIEERTNFDIIFIKDHSGNIFEIKESAIII